MKLKRPAAVHSAGERYVENDGCTRTYVQNINSEDHKVRNRMLATQTDSRIRGPGAERLRRTRNRIVKCLGSFDVICVTI